MATLKQGLATYLLEIPGISDAVGGRIYSRRVVKGKTNPPYIVYSVDGSDNKNGFNQGAHGYKGKKVVVDLVGPYADEDDLEVLFDLLQSHLGGKQGDFGGWIGSISIIYDEIGYDDKNDFTVFRLGLLCKSTF